MKTFVTEYYLQDAGGQSPYTPWKSNCAGFDFKLAAIDDN